MDFHKLAHAVQHNDLDWFLTDQTLSNCLRVSQKKTGDTVLHLACRFGRRDLLEQFILCEGVDMEISNYEGKKPLHEAAQFGQLDCVGFLLHSGVKVDCLKRADWTPLMLACTKPQLPIISLLLKHGADPALVNKDSWNSFHIAAREGHVRILQTLLNINHGLWNTVSQNGRTPLHSAALHGKTEAVRFLLDKCDYAPDTPDSCGVTPLMDALRAGFVDIAQILISQHKADVNKEDNLGRQALHHAAQAGQTIAVQFLLTSCDVPVDEGQEAVMHLLIQNGADINLVDCKGRTALHIASGGQHASSVKLLLDSGAKDVPDLSNQLAQHLAVKQPVKDAFDGGHGS